MIAIRVDTSSLEKKLRDVAAKVKDVRPVLKAWATETAIDLGRQWDDMTYQKLYLAPGNFRSGAAEWRKVPPLYVRKDGTAIPPWGGVKRVRGQWIHTHSDIKSRKKFFVQKAKVSGNVSGRLRPSNKRVKPTSIVGKDTNTMFRQFVRSPKIAPSGRSISLVTVTAYAKWQNKLRPFNKLKQSDTDRLKRIYIDFLKAKMGEARG